MWTEIAALEFRKHMDTKATSQPTEQAVIPSMQREPDLIAGWLYLLGIGLIVSPILNAFHLQELVGAAREADWIFIRQQGPAVLLLIAFEFVIQLFMLVFSIFLAWLFLRRRASFPKTFIVYIVSLFFMGLVGVVLAALAPSATPESVGATIAFPMYVLLLGAIWGTYLVRSERVKRTFTLPVSVSSKTVKSNRGTPTVPRWDWLRATDPQSRFARFSSLLGITATVVLGGGAAVGIYQASSWQQLVSTYYRHLNSAIAECERDRDSVSCEFVEIYREGFDESVQSRDTWSVRSRRLGAGAVVAPFVAAFLYFGGLFVWTGGVRRRSTSKREERS